MDWNTHIHSTKKSTKNFLLMHNLAMCIFNILSQQADFSFTVITVSLPVRSKANKQMCISLCWFALVICKSACPTLKNICFQICFCTLPYILKPHFEEQKYVHVFATSVQLVLLKLVTCMWAEKCTNTHWGAFKWKRPQALYFPYITHSLRTRTHDNRGTNWRHGTTCSHVGQLKKKLI